MFEKFAARLSYANVMATVAVFIAIGGGAYAAGLAKDSVGSKQIKDGKVKGVDVKDNSLMGTDINEGSLSKVPDAAHADTATDATTLQGAALGTLQSRVRWAIVGSNGSIVTQSGGIQVSAHPASPPGLYYLDFGVPTSGKAITVTGRYPPTSALPGTFGTRACGSAPDATACNADGDPAGDPNDGNHLLVVTYAGTVQNDEPFYIALIP